MGESNVKYVEINKAVPKDAEGEDGWYFNAVAANGEIVSTSEVYTTKADAKRGAEGVFPGVEQIEEDQEASE